MKKSFEQGYLVPFYSQYNTGVSKKWKNRACGTACLKMVFDFWNKENTDNKTDSLKNVIKIGYDNGAFVKNIGWSHSGLVSLAGKYGYDGFNKDLPLMGLNFQESFKRLKNDLKYFPIIASVWNRFYPASKSGHLVVVTGIKNGEVFLNDPFEKNEKLGKKIISEAQFKKAFKKRYIAVHPKGLLSRTDKMRIFNVDINKSYFNMIRNSVGTKLFLNFYIDLPQGKRDVLRNGDLSCSAFVSSILYLWGLISDTHANVNLTTRDMLNNDWRKIKKPRKGCVVEWDYKKMANGETHKHLGFYLGNKTAISNRPEKKSPQTHHYTFGVKNGKPVRKIVAIYWHPELENSR